MSLDLFGILICSILALVAHGSRYQSWLAWVLRVIIAISFGGEALTALSALASLTLSSGDNALLSNAATSAWNNWIVVGTATLTGLIMFRSCRELISRFLTMLDALVSGRVFIAMAKKANVAQAFFAEKIFWATSMPHQVAMWIYITVGAFLLGVVDPSTMKMPQLPIAIPVPAEQLLSYNGFGLVMLALCGIGIFVSRKFPQACERLGWMKPTMVQVFIGIGLIAFTFAYDYLWSLYTHNIGGEIASKLTDYNSGTFTSGGGGAGPSLVLALLVALCAGIGEETLMRGALQPAFGIFPAALLHGLLHGQFSHAPILIIQVTLWSSCMGIVRRYTNTTTTIIGHAGFNFLTTFLFSFNPPLPPT